MQLILDLLHNHMLVCAIGAGASAQFIKIIISIIKTKKFKAERLLGAGGMPSAHSATVCGLVVSCWRLFGLSSFQFAFALVFAAIVIYDAMGVRFEAGQQAKVINQIVKINNNDEIKSNDIYGFRELKERLGHTPYEVLGGIVYGSLFALLMPIF